MDKRMNIGLKIMALAFNKGWSLDHAKRAIDSEEYLVMTKQEADHEARSMIKDNLWALTPEELHPFLPTWTIAELEKFLGNGQIELNNPVLIGMLTKSGALELLLQKMLKDKGNAHYLAYYDRIERKQQVEGMTFYIYRRE